MVLEVGKCFWKKKKIDYETYQLNDKEVKSEHKQ